MGVVGFVNLLDYKGAALKSATREHNPQSIIRVRCLPNRSRQEFVARAMQIEVKSVWHDLYGGSVAEWIRCRPTEAFTWVKTPQTAPCGSETGQEDSDLCIGLRVMR